MSATLPRCTPFSLRMGPFGKTSLVEIAVLVRVGIDDASDRSMLRGNLRFDSPPRLAVPGDDDRPFNRDAQAVEGLIVLGDAVVHVDERRGDVSIN